MSLLSVPSAQLVLLRKLAIPVGFLIAISPLFNSAMALALGVTIGLVLGNDYSAITRKWTKKLLSIAIVGMGAGMNLYVIGRAGMDGVLYTFVSLTLTMLLGLLLSYLFKVRWGIAILVSAGTAICGGSAIAAVSAALSSDENDTSISLGIVFILNAIALVVFPLLGHALNLSEQQFGLWSALAIHDTSSVVGATVQYGAHALEVGTTVKLVRALWIIPLTIVITWIYRDRVSKNTGKRQYPWFILGFVLAAALVTWVPELQPVGYVVERISKHLLAGALFLIGVGFTRASLKKVGMRPLAFGIALWLIIATGNLFYLIK